MLLLVFDVLLEVAFLLFEFGHLGVEFFLLLLQSSLLGFLFFQQGSLFFAGLLAGLQGAADLLFCGCDLVHLHLAGVGELADIAQSAEGLVEILRGEDEAQTVVMIPVFVGEDDHLGVFLLQLAKIGVEALDVVLAYVDFLIEDGNLFVAGLDELFALLDFVFENRHFVECHFLVLGGLFQQLVGVRNLFLQGGDFALQLLLGLAFGFLGVG